MKLGLGAMLLCGVLALGPAKAEEVTKLPDVSSQAVAAPVPEKATPVIEPEPQGTLASFNDYMHSFNLWSWKQIEAGSSWFGFISVPESARETTRNVLLNFVNDPLTTITVSTVSLAGAGVTASTVQCVKDSTAGTETGETTTSTTPHTTIALKPGAYVCTVVIDP